MSKNVDKCEKENSKQIENLNGKVSILEKSVNTQIPKELSKIESMQKIISENEKSVSTLKKSLDANGQELEKLKTKVGQVLILANQFLKQQNHNIDLFSLAGQISIKILELCRNLSQISNICRAEYLIPLLSNFVIFGAYILSKNGHKFVLLVFLKRSQCRRASKLSWRAAL